MHNMQMAPRNYMQTLVSPTGEGKAAVLTPKQFRRLLREAGVGRNGVRNTAIVWHLFASAFRITELGHLRVKDVVSKGGEIKPIGRLPGKFAKNGKPRPFIQMEDELVEAVQKYLDYRKARRLRLGDSDEYQGLSPDSPLYLSRGPSGFAKSIKKRKSKSGEDKDYIVFDSLQQLISKLFDDANIENGSTHSGRRTFATRLHDRGVDEGLIQALLGHSDLNQTIGYIDPNKKEVREALAGLHIK